MAALLRSRLLFRKLLLGTDDAGLCKYSTQASKCVLMVEDGPLNYPMDQFEDWKDYLKRKPLLEQILSPWLYGSLDDPNRPYKTTDDARKILRSGALAVRSCNKSAYSVDNLFREGNVGVIGKIHSIAFLSVEPGPATDTSTADPSIGYNNFAKFIKQSIFDSHKVSPSNMPKQMEAYLEDLEQGSVNEDFIVDHPCTMTNVLYADTCVQLYWLLVKDLPAINFPSTHIEDVFADIGKKHGGALVVALQHEFLHQFLPKYLQKTYPAHKYGNFVAVQTLSDIARGHLVVEVCRHATIHSMDKDVIALVSTRLKISSYNHDDITEVLRMVFSEMFRAAHHQLVLKGI